MSNLESFLSEFNLVTVLIRVFLSVLLGGLIGSERGRHGRAAGLRTHIMVCLGATMTSLTSLYIAEVLGYSGDVARISAQVISGIGFLGAGTIMVRNNSFITGLTTAAGMWATAAIGIANGYGFYVGAILATFICFFSFTVLSKLERKRKSHVNLYFEISNPDIFDVALKVLNDNGGTAFRDITPPKSGLLGNVGVICQFSNAEASEQATQKLKTIEGVLFIINNTDI